MAIDISRLGAAAQKQILKKLREADVKKIEREEKERIAGGGAKAAPAVRENKNKLHAERTADGHASKREAQRAAELRLLEKSGEIRNLSEQVPIYLLPTIYKTEGGALWRVFGPQDKKEAEREARCKLELLERGVYYVCDFIYEDCKTGETIYEDAKGYKNPSSAEYKVFVLKRKMCLHFHEIRVREV